MKRAKERVEEKQKTAGLEECGGEGEKTPHVKANLHNSCSAPFRNSSFIRTGLLHCSNAVCVRMCVCVRERNRVCDASNSACSGMFVSCALSLIAVLFPQRLCAVHLSTQMFTCMCVC